jgi:alkylhydroperoxidase/carboxymuconolactone decarboxylase family protein YurZ
MGNYKQHLRRLAVHDEELLESSAAEKSSFPASVMDERTTALVRIAATLAMDAASPSLHRAATHALAVGVTPDEIVAALEAVTPVIGPARVVQRAPMLGLVLGYDVDAALERLDH